VRTPLAPPSGFEGHLSRRQAAAALGFASEYKVRQLERQGKLRAVRGALGSAWYRREEVLALGRALASALPPGPRRWTDAELLRLLRERPRSPVDLVVDTGISIARAERVHRFFRAHERGQEIERRSPERRERDALVRQMRDPDPQVRAAAFERLRSTR
jgi:hypothetical protein